jgi:hypothetical protein
MNLTATTDAIVYETLGNRDNKPFSTSKEWYDYIVKLNDRNLTRHKATGFTSWGLLAVIAVLISEMGKHFYNIHTMEGSQFVTVMLWQSIISLVVLVLVNVILTYTFVVNIAVTPRCMGKLTRKTRPILITPIILFLTIGIIATSYTYNGNFVSGSMFVFILVTYGIYLVALAIMLLYPRIMVGREHNKIPIFDIIVHVKTKWKKVFVIGFVIVSSIAIFEIFQTWQINSKNPFFVNVSCLKIAIYFTLVNLLLFFLAINISSLFKNSISEAIENKIVIDQLPADKIRELYTDFVLGESTKDWVAKVREEIFKKDEAFKKEHLKALNELNDISKINTEYSKEIEHRAIKTCLEVKKKYDEYLKSIFGYHKYYKTLKLQSIFADIEEDGLKLFFNDIQKQLLESRKQLNTFKLEVCEKCSLNNKLNCVGIRGNLNTVTAFDQAFSKEQII